MCNTYLGCRIFDMDRKEINEQDLIEIINRQMQKHEECEGCNVSGLAPLAEPDSKGCNWSEPWVNCGDTPAEVCQPVATRVIHNLQAKYNLAK